MSLTCNQLSNCGSVKSHICIPLPNSRDLSKSPHNVTLHIHARVMTTSSKPKILINTALV